MVCGSVLLYFDGTVLNSGKDIVVFSFWCLAALFLLGMSLYAFINTWKESVQVSIKLKYLALSLPIFWVLGTLLGYWASTSIIKDSMQRNSSLAVWACESLFEKSDSRWSKCLAAYPLCAEKPNACSNLGSKEAANTCLAEFGRLLSQLSPDDKLKIDARDGRYDTELNKVCLLKQSSK